VLQAELAWFRGDGDAVNVHVARAEEMVDTLEPSYSKAFVLSDLARYAVLGGQSAHALDRGQQALRLAEDLGLDELRSAALDNVGLARINLGDADGIADVEAAVELAKRINSPELARALNNLSVVVGARGENRRAMELTREALAVARELGNKPVEHFVRGTLPWFDYVDGNWDAALRDLTELLSEAEQGGGHVNEGPIVGIRARIRFARGDVQGATDDARRSYGHWRRSTKYDPEGPAYLAWLSLQIGDGDGVNTLLDELPDTPEMGESLPLEGALALTSSGRHDELRAISARMTQGLWADVFVAIADGRPLAAAEALEADGSHLPQVALLRLEAAKQLASRGDAAEIGNILGPAIDFWKSVGATHWLAEAQSLLPPTAKRRAKAPVSS